MVYKAIRRYLLYLLTLSNITVSDESCFIQINIHIFVKKMWKIPWVVAHYSPKTSESYAPMLRVYEVRFFSRWIDYDQELTNNPSSQLSLVQMDTTIELNNIPINKSGKLITSTELMVSIKIM